MAMEGWTRRHTSVLAGLLAMATVLAATGALWESPWEDEYYSLRGAEDMRGYRFMPVYFVWLKIGHALSADFHWLRVWSFAPFVAGLWLARGLLARVGARPGEILVTIGLLAANPFLLQECMRIRYYAFFFFAAVVAMRAYLWLLAGHGALPRRVLACLLLLLPQLTVYSGIAVLAVMFGDQMCRRRIDRRTLPVVVIPVLIAAGLAGVKLATNLQFLRYADLRRVVANLPINLGYEKAPPDGFSLAYQYDKLLGWNYPSWYLPPHAVELFASLVVMAIAVRFWRARRPHRGLVLAVALIPVMVWVAAWLINALDARYYLYASLPLAYMSAVALGDASRRMRARVARLLLPAAFGACCAASLAISFVVPTNAPIDRLIEAARRHDVRTLVVSPVWLAAPLAAFFARSGASTQVIGIGSEAAPPRPAWVFRKYPRYTWPSRKQRDAIDLDDYEPVLWLQSLKKYYFHPTRVTDVLLRRRDG